MSNDERMTIDERRKHLRTMKGRYEVATRKGRSTLPTEVVQVTGLHRRSLIRLMNGDLRRKPRRR